MMSKCEIEQFYAAGKQQTVHGGSSKGAQDKYYSNGYWYKRDSVGYESIAEVLASRVAKITNANLIIASYCPVMIQTKLDVHLGCKSQSYLADGDREYTLARLLEKDLGVAYHSSLFPTEADLIVSTVSCFAKLGCRQHLCDQLSCLLQLDRLILNVDRHLHNIALVQHKSGSFDLVYFDNGDSLASDITYDFDESLSADDCFHNAVARPFSSHFDEQCRMMAAYSEFRLKDIQSTLKVSDICGLIPERVFIRMLNILTCTFDKYLGTKIKFI